MGERDCLRRPGAQGPREFEPRRINGHRTVSRVARIGESDRAAPDSDTDGPRELAVIGYASGPGPGPAARQELDQQAEVITEGCARRGLRLVELVHEREPTNGKALSRPGLAYALERISHGAAAGVVVTELSRITRSAAELGRFIEWLRRSGARLVAVEQAFDTGKAEGRLAADLLVEVSRWESVRLSERTRNGLEAARRNGRLKGRPAVNDYSALQERIAQMRSEGLTLQAIADQFNREGVPTVRGGRKWRHSSIQSAAGYRRPSRSTPLARR